MAKGASGCYTGKTGVNPQILFLARLSRLGVSAGPVLFPESGRGYREPSITSMTIFIIS